MASKIAFSKSLKELRIILCQESKSSEGIREFVKKHYVSLKSTNPNTPILIRECSKVQPKIYARYELGKESSVSVANENADKILKRIEEFSKQS